MYHIFIHSVIDSCLGCFHVMAGVNNAVNLGVQVPIQISVFVIFRYGNNELYTHIHLSLFYHFIRDYNKRMSHVNTFVSIYQQGTVRLNCENASVVEVSRFCSRFLYLYYKGCTCKRWSENDIHQNSYWC